MNDDPTLLSASELLLRYRTKSLSPVEVTQATLARISTLDPVLNAYCLVDEQSALSTARASEARWRAGEPLGLLDGIPTCIKDLILTKGWPTLRGSRTVAADQAWQEDAPCVARLREHGAVLLGKTTTPEFGWKGVTDSPLTGVSRNPWNTAMTPGGSSGGSAAAVASGMAALAIGTDGGGSIRIPCAFTGLFGIKPSFGRVPAYPMSPFGTVGQVGPITRTVTDAALMLNVISEPDWRDPLSLPYDRCDYRVALGSGVKGLRMAFSADLGYASVNPEITALVRQAADVLADLGADLDEVDPGFDDPWECFTTTWFVGAAYLARHFDQDKRKLLDPGLLQIIEKGEDYTLTDYLDAQNTRGELSRRMRRFHEDYDLLLTPSLPIPAFAAGQETPDEMKGKRWSNWTPFTYPFNLTGQPAASVPCGFTADGLPAGLQIVGPAYSDALVLRVSRALEVAKPFSFPDTRAITAT